MNQSRQYYCSNCGSRDIYSYTDNNTFCECCLSWNSLVYLTTHESRVIKNAYLERKSYEKEMDKFLDLKTTKR